MIDNAVFGEPGHLSAGSSQYEVLSDGDGGPSAAEERIEAKFLDWGAPLEGGDEWTSYMSDGALFWDEDHNNYYDHLQISGESGVWRYDPDTDSWVYHAHVDG
jgi:hypothetical protein